MKASKLVLTIFFGFIFTVVAYLCFYMLSSNHNRGMKDEVHYVPFEAPFKHLVVEDGWRLSAYLSDVPELFGEMRWFNADSGKIQEIEAKLAPNGMLMTQYYPDYDDKELMSRIEIKNDTLFFREVKIIESSIRSIRLNLSGLSSVEVSGKSSVVMSSTGERSLNSPFNLGQFTIKTSDQASARTNWLSFEKLIVRSEDFSRVTLEWMYGVLQEDAKEVLLNSDALISGNAILRVSSSFGKVRLAKYEIKDEAALSYPQISVETVYGKKFSRYYKDFNKRVGETSTSSN
tara:strand:- start:613 stop:1479 length:867 start_codon:yes stop_codon:yes gene_type:complete